MRAGSLRHRVELQEPVDSARDAYGSKKPTWNTVFSNIPMEIRPISGKEAEVVRQTHPNVTHFGRVRYSPEFTSLRRLKEGDRIFEIEAVLNLGERNREMRLELKEAV